MPQYLVSTGTSGTIKIDDNNVDYFTIDMKYGAGDFDSVIEQMPWTLTLNGVKEGWKAFDLYSGDFYQRLGRIWVGKAQTVTFHLGDTGTTEVGGPLDYSFYVQRGTMQSAAYITDGATTKRAVPYVNVGGVWRTAEAYSKQNGEWKQTT